MTKSQVLSRLRSHFQAALTQEQTARSRGLQAQVDEFHARAEALQLLGLEVGLSYRDFEFSGNPNSKEV